jgi:hypothetical protein
MACDSRTGLKQGSMRKMRFACVKLIPTAPAGILNKKIVIGGSFLKFRKSLHTLLLHGHVTRQHAELKAVFRWLFLQPLQRRSELRKHETFDFKFKSP